MNLRSLQIRPAAYADIDAIAGYIRQDNLSRAASFIEELTDKFTTICERPLSFPARDEIYLGLRSALHGRYLILFFVSDRAVDIARVIHGARDMEALFADGLA